MALKNIVTIGFMGVLAAGTIATGAAIETKQERDHVQQVLHKTSCNTESCRMYLYGCEFAPLLTKLEEEGKLYSWYSVTVGKNGCGMDVLFSRNQLKHFVRNIPKDLEPGLVDAELKKAPDWAVSDGQRVHTWAGENVHTPEIPLTIDEVYE